MFYYIIFYTKLSLGNRQNWSLLCRVAAGNSPRGQPQTSSRRRRSQRKEAAAAVASLSLDAHSSPVFRGEEIELEEEKGTVTGRPNFKGEW